MNTTLEPLSQLVESQRHFFLTDQTKSYAFRLQQLKTLKKAILMYQHEILDALFQDLHKGEVEAFTTEVGFNLRSISDSIKHLKRWMKPRSVKGELFLPFTSSKVMSEPKGVVLLIGPFNYPFQLVIEPLIGAIAAGNTAIIKPSEFTPTVSAVMSKMINAYFPPEYISVVEGDASVTQALLTLRYDHIFFTGSTRVGQLVYEAASKHLTPVTLELGGKSPTIIDASANLPIAAERIAFAKFTNAGQTCIAPDYVYVHEKVKDAFIQALKKVIAKRYSDSSSFGHIVSDRHFQRLKGLVPFEITHDDSRYFPPTLIEHATWSDPSMKEEIFGPILPILTFKTIDEVIETLKSKEKPLALYLFSENKAVQKRVWQSLSFGNGAINDALMQVASRYLPFGGVGQSGFGSYHGKQSFDTFSHQKSYIKKSTKIDLPIAYPPYKPSQLKIMKKLMK
jgi:aldehyde dehydrogenase (NAD+)